MKEQVTEAEKRELDRVRDERRTKQPYASEVDDREIQQAQDNAPRREPAKSKPD